MPRVMINNNHTSTAFGGNKNNLDASFRGGEGGGLASQANIRGSSSNISNQGPPVSKEPKVYQFEPCLSFCCCERRFDHVKSAAGIAVAGILIGLAAFKALIYLAVKSDEMSWLPAGKSQLSFFAIGFAVFTATNVLLLAGIVVWRRNLFCPWLFMVFPMNLFLFGSIFFLLYKIISGDDDEQEEEQGQNNNSTSSGDQNKLDEAVQKVQDVGKKVGGLDYIFLAITIVALVLLWYFWSLVWSLYIRMGKGCSKEHQLPTPQRIRRKRNGRNEQAPPPLPPPQPPTPTVNEEGGQEGD